MRLALRASMFCLFLGGFAGQASADIMYRLVDVELGYLNSDVDLGKLTGWFTISDDLTLVTAAEITATEAPTPGGFTYNPTTYAFNPGDSVNQSVLSQNTLVLVNGSGAQRLQLTFAAALTGTGTTDLINPSSEYQFQAGERIVLSGSVMADTTPVIPEPSSIATFVIGAPIALAFARRYRRAAKSAA